MNLLNGAKRLLELSSAPDLVRGQRVVGGELVRARHGRIFEPEHRRAQPARADGRFACAEVRAHLHRVGEAEEAPEGAFVPSFAPEALEVDLLGQRCLQRALREDCRPFGAGVVEAGECIGEVGLGEAEFKQLGRGEDAVMLVPAVVPRRVAELLAVRIIVDYRGGE